MIGWILAAMGVTAVACAIDSNTREKNDAIRHLEAKNAKAMRYLEMQRDEIRYLKAQNHYLILTIQNQRQLLSNYDYVNRYAKNIGYKGAVQFFYYLTEYHDERFGHFARFLNKVRCIRNDIAHNGRIYEIDDGFLQKLAVCKYICDEYSRLPSWERLYLG